MAGDEVVTELCPIAVREQLLEILRWALVSIRRAAERNDCGICIVEANHVHNIPDLIEAFSRDRLSYYLDVEATQYAREIGPQLLPRVQAAWAVLAEWLKNDLR
jgi:hypothetical protein